MLPIVVNKFGYSEGVIHVELDFWPPMSGWVKTAVACIKLVVGLRVCADCRDSI